MQKRKATTPSIINKCVVEEREDEREGVARILRELLVIVK